jgi:hypothetical protein
MKILNVYHTIFVQKDLKRQFFVLEDRYLVNYRHSGDEYHQEINMNSIIGSDPPSWKDLNAMLPKLSIA